ncbi:sensor histidine kinase [Mycolicibacterium hassiacum]|uniref:sensor histidine kinase n=1 Tax=Mycolicibacterium hassiacum TaxID=46351 RepID=UPI0023F8407A|nr:HAMP domain-containing sensor histidine kinase [Mycolicibacterium hassiacum]
MSSSPRPERRNPLGLPGLRGWSLRARLVLTQVMLLAVVCAGICVATEFALQRFLVHQLDQQVLETARRSAVIYRLGPPPPGGFGLRPPPPGWVGPSPPERPRRILYRVPREDDGPGPSFLNAPGQATRTVGAVLADGRPIEAGVITADGGRAEISEQAAGQLAALPPEGRPTTVDLDGLGRYRLVAHALGPDRTIVTGLPMTDVDATLLSVLMIFGVVGVVVLGVAATVGTLIIRRQLAPLSRASAAARQVADLELERGEVRLPTPIVKVDPASAHTEIGQLGSALNRMLDRIASALATRHASETRIRQFVADASHELRTPLAAIRGYSELVQRRHAELPDDVAHAMDRVQSETERMTQLVEDMLLLARLDTGRPLDFEPVDLTRLVVDATSDAHVAAPEHRWSLDLPDEPVVVEGDEARLRQVLANLLANARVHTPPGTAVTTSLAVHDDAVVLTVADDGPGIPEWLQPEVFQRFARGDSSRSRRGGSTGLGLAIVAAVVKAHRGTIDVHSVPGDTRFVVRLPR